MQWGKEENRAIVRVFDPDVKTVRNYATGLRNCSGLVMQPGTANLWCIANERDHLGPDVTPDFMTRVQENAFYGWPWYYLGDREDPALKESVSTSRVRRRVVAPGALRRAQRRVLRGQCLPSRITVVMRSSRCTDPIADQKWPVTR